MDCLESGLPNDGVLPSAASPSPSEHKPNLELDREGEYVRSVMNYLVSINTVKHVGEQTIMIPINGSVIQLVIDDNGLPSGESPGTDSAYPTSQAVRENNLAQVAGWLDAQLIHEASLIHNDNNNWDWFLDPNFFQLQGNALSRDRAEIVTNLKQDYPKVHLPHVYTDTKQLKADQHLNPDPDHKFGKLLSVEPVGSEEFESNCIGIFGRVLLGINQQSGPIEIPEDKRKVYGQYRSIFNNKLNETRPNDGYGLIHAGAIKSSAIKGLEINPRR